MTHGLLLKDKGRNFMVPFPLSFSLPHSPSVIHLHWYDLVNILHRWAMTDFFFLDKWPVFLFPWFCFLDLFRFVFWKNIYHLFFPQTFRQNREEQFWYSVWFLPWETPLLRRSLILLFQFWKGSSLTGILRRPFCHLLNGSSPCPPGWFAPLFCWNTSARSFLVQ